MSNPDRLGGGWGGSYINNTTQQDLLCVLIGVKLLRDVFVTCSVMWTTWTAVSMQNQ